MAAKNPRVLYRHQLYKGPRLRKKLKAAARPELTIPEILTWADDYHNRTGRWPNRGSGRISRVTDQTWEGINGALAKGRYGLPGNSSLAKLLDEKRGVRNKQDLPPFTINQILQLADNHHKRTGEWPRINSGPIVDAPGETWSGVNAALQAGIRGMQGGSTLARLLATHRQVRYAAGLPPLHEEQILRWADRHHRRTGSWPTATDGLIVDAVGETWSGISASLYSGNRGLPGGSSLPRLLATHRGVRNVQGLSPLSPELILAWADNHRERTGEWPTRLSGPVANAEGEVWGMVDAALTNGNRGLPGGSSLPRLLAAHRGVRNIQALPQLSQNQILAWADDYRKRTGKWPTRESGSIPDAPSESWRSVNFALRKGSRGLPGGSSLTQLLVIHRNAQSKAHLPPLSENQILTWADSHQERTGEWPTVNSGSISDAPGESWRSIDKALRLGYRGFPGGSSLFQLLSVHGRGHRLTPLSVEMILLWADHHRERTENWPTLESGAIADAPGESWRAVHVALVRGSRGLSGGSSLARLLKQRRNAWHGRIVPPVSVEQILAWADDHKKRTGEWPGLRAGPILAAPTETWFKVDNALRIGCRGLPGGSSLAQVLKANRSK